MAEPAIDVRDVSRSFGDQRVLIGVSMQVFPGQIVGLVGPSGAGKTTLVRLIAGADTSPNGEVQVAGHSMPALSVLDRVGYMAQSDALYLELSGAQNMRFFGSLYGMRSRELVERIATLSEMVGLAADIDRPAVQYSEGMKRRLSLAIALLHRPPILLLDEPTVSIDPVLRASIWGRLRDYAADNTAILVTTHVMDEAEKCDLVAMLREGRILRIASPSDLKAESGGDNMEQAFLHFVSAA